MRCRLPLLLLALLARPVLAEPVVDEALARELQDEMSADRSEEQAIQRALVEQFDAAMRDFRQAAELLTRVELQCVQHPEDLEYAARDLVRHRRLSRADFRATSASPDVRVVVDVPGTEVGAHVALRLVCIANPVIERLESGQYEARVEEVSYVALLDPDGSWWNPAADATAEWTIRHEQCHFDLAEILARELGREGPFAVARTRAEGGTAAEAAQRFSAAWRQHLAEVHERFEEVELRYDRETAHGMVPAKQTEWFERCQRGLRETARR
jgi:hypothetical protein